MQGVQVSQRTTWSYTDTFSSTDSISAKHGRGRGFSYRYNASITRLLRQSRASSQAWLVRVVGSHAIRTRQRIGLCASFTPSRSNHLIIKSELEI